MPTGAPVSRKAPALESSPYDSVPARIARSAAPIPRARSIAMPSAASATAGAKAGLATSTWMPRSRAAA